MDKNTIRVAEAPCEMDKNTIRVAEVCEWIRTPSGLLRSVNG